MPTTITRYVNTASSGGDGTTNNESGGTAAYASLDACRAAEVSARPNLVSNDEVLEILCCGSAADTTPVALSGFTTDATRYLHIKGNTGHANGRHPGYPSTDHYRLWVSANFGRALLLSVNYTRIDGLQIRNDHVNAFSGVRVEADFCEFDGVLLRADATSAFEGRGSDSWFRNCVAYSSADGFRNFNTSATYYDNCCAVGNSGPGFTDSVTNASVPRNCYSGGNGTGFVNMVTPLENCHSSDGSQSTTTTAYSTSSGAYFTDITAGAQNLHLQASSALRAVGTDLSSDFTLDIDRETRPTGSSTWDVGVDQYSASAPLEPSDNAKLAFMEWGLPWESSLPRESA